MSIACAASTVPWYGQCGGSGYDGPTNCVAGSSCEQLNEYFSMVRTPLRSSAFMAPAQSQSASITVRLGCTVRAWPPCLLAGRGLVIGSACTWVAMETCVSAHFLSNTIAHSSCQCIATANRIVDTLNDSKLFI